RRANGIHLPPPDAPLPRLQETLSSDADAALKVDALQQSAAYGERATPAIPALIAALDDTEYVRQNAIYTLAAIGPAAVAPLAADLAQR
ncbi:hypothetical protein ABTL42_19390, partial [Acinetobacter baumannii]